MEWLVEPLSNFNMLIAAVGGTCPDVWNQCTCEIGLASCNCSKGLQVSPK